MMELEKSMRKYNATVLKFDLDETMIISYSGGDFDFCGIKGIDYYDCFEDLEKDHPEHAKVVDVVLFVEKNQFQIGNRFLISNSICTVFNRTEDGKVIWHLVDEKGNTFTKTTNELYEMYIIGLQMGTKIIENYPKIVFTDDGNGNMVEKEYEVYADYKVGDIMTSSYGAPGIGHRIVKFIAKDDVNIYAEIVEDTGRILEPWECE